MYACLSYSLKGEVLLTAMRLVEFMYLFSLNYLDAFLVTKLEHDILNLILPG